MSASWTGTVTFSRLGCACFHQVKHWPKLGFEHNQFSVQNHWCKLIKIFMFDIQEDHVCNKCTSLTPHINSWLILYFITTTFPMCCSDYFILLVTFDTYLFSHNVDYMNMWCTNLTMSFLTPYILFSLIMIFLYSLITVHLVFTDADICTIKVTLPIF